MNTSTNISAKHYTIQKYEMCTSKNPSSKLHTIINIFKNEHWLRASTKLYWDQHVIQTRISPSQ